MSKYDIVLRSNQTSLTVSHSEVIPLKSMNVAIKLIDVFTGEIYSEDTNEMKKLGLCDVLADALTEEASHELEQIKVNIDIK